MRWCILLCGAAAAAELVGLGPVCIAPAIVDAMAFMSPPRGAVLPGRSCVGELRAAPTRAAALLLPQLRWLRVPAVDYWYGYASVIPMPMHPGMFPHLA
jgi:hypothetical protein